jgi:hypothetical protein
MTSHRGDRDPKAFLDYLERPILNGLEGLKEFVKPTKPGAPRPPMHHLTVPSVLLMIARMAHEHKQEVTAKTLSMPQSHVSRLQNGARPWVTKDFKKCRVYVREAPREGIVKAFLELVEKEFDVK